jgi:uncharacterized membrane protein
VKTHSATLKKIGDALNTGDDKGVVIAVAAALIIVAAVVAGYYILLHPTPEGYTDFYVLDSQGKAVNYTVTLIVNQNYTFNIGVVNHMGQTLPCEVQLKVTNETISLFPAEIAPINTYSKTLTDGEIWEPQATVTLHETGSYSIIFELWIRRDAGTLEFTGNALNLNVEAVNQP